jgi:hypothetical protein
VEEEELHQSSQRTEVYKAMHTAVRNLQPYRKHDWLLITMRWTTRRADFQT